ncbi:MAG: flagellar protein FliS [Planctomycetota bacterium]|nr:flagellar protein FliS [Planctomycetota bacterium]
MYEDLSNYVEQQVQDASPAKLIDLLFSRARRDLAQALEQHALDGEMRSQAEAIRLIVHAQQIVVELARSLNLKDGGELARNLQRIYEYMNYRLKEAIDLRNPASAREVLALLAELHEGWGNVLQADAPPEGAASGSYEKGGILVA